MQSVLKTKILEYWHISRTALAKQDDQGRHARMKYVADTLKQYDKELIERCCTNPYTGLFSNKQVWFAIEDAIN